MELGLQKKQKIEEEDRISQLPGDILHQILYLLPIKTAGRTSILSKSWQHAWSSFSYNLDFDDEVERIKEEHVEEVSYFGKKSEIERKFNQFTDFIYKSLQTRVGNKSIEKLRLRLTFLDRLVQEKCLEKLVTFATDRNIKELTLDVCKLSYEYVTINWYKVSHRPCDMPQVMCESKTITVLKLSGFDCQNYSGGFNISQLRILSLSQVSICDYQIWPLIRNCPLIECLELKYCKKLETLKLPNLLRLDSLHVLRCKNLWKIEISCQKLHQFTLRECTALKQVTIDAPNLVSLECKLNKFIKSPYYIFKSIPSLKQVHLECRLGCYSTFWANDLKEIIGKFNNPAGLNLVILFDKGNAIVLESLSEVMVCSLLINLMAWRPEIILSSTNTLSLVKRLLHGRQLEALSIVSSSSNLVEIFNKEVEPRCYKDSSTECWWNSLDDAKIEDLDKAEDFGNSNWIALLKSYQAMQYQTTTFRLKWIPH